MVDLDKGKIITYYSANTKISMMQQALVNGERYFRTGSAKEKGLNWAIKANSFTLPIDDAPLEPSSSSTLNSFSPAKKPRSSSPRQKSSQNPPKPRPSKSGEKAEMPKKKGGILKGLMKLLGR